MTKWIESMPFLEFSELDINEVLVCEKHFDDTKIVRRNGIIQGLIPDAFPSIFLLPDRSKYEISMPPVMIDQHQQIPIQEMVSVPVQEVPFPISIKEQPENHQHIIEMPLTVEQPNQIESLQQYQTQEDQVQSNFGPELVEEIQQVKESETVEDSGFACRFCLRGIQDSDDSIMIDGSIKKHFKNLTNIEVSFLKFNVVFL